MCVIVRVEMLVYLASESKRSLFQWFPPLITCCISSELVVPYDIP